MRILSVHLKEGLFERKIDFNKHVTLIHSNKNSCGKTTLIRFLLYGFGYNIPNTRQIKFNNCDISMKIESEKLGEVILTRSNSFSIILNSKNEKCTYVLPEQQLILHAKLFGTENVDILNNLLGAFYVDQEKGWTLLNRGLVIGSVHFNVEALVRGLSNRDCSSMIAKVAKLQRELEKYKQMSSVALYRESLEKENGSLVTESYEESSNAELSALLTRKRQLKNELTRIDKTIADNKSFKNYISEMKLLVKLPHGDVFPVREDNIVGLNDAMELLITKRKIVSQKYADTLAQVEILEREQDKEFEQIAFFHSASQIEIFDKKIMQMPINAQIIQKEILRLVKEIKTTQEKISSMTQKNNEIVDRINKNIITYCTELGVGTNETIPMNYLFTSNLKELTGAILHKTIFAFRLAYIIAIEETLNIKLPIILDSPSGKEVDKNNIALMMNILKRDFSENQIIIASIYTYDFADASLIEITNRLIDEIVQE